MPAKTHRLPTATSLSLDVIRFGSALVIAVVHIAQRYFSTGWPDMVESVGLPAVAVFFILSGFVIRYVTCIKYSTLGEYTIDRASRIYSVVLPAILFTIVADTISYHANPSYYLANWGDAISQPGLRIFANVTFLSQVWSRDVALFSNGPFWTLSFECLYYALYGAAFYLTRTRRILWLAVLALVMGPHMLMLVPLWAIGCVVHDIYQHLSGRNIPLRRFNLVMCGIVVAGTLLWVPAVRAIYTVKQYETLLFWHFHHKPLDLAWITWYYRAGFVFGFLLLWSSVLLNHLKLDGKSKSVRWVRLCSEGTFPLYLLHFPLFVLIASLVSYDHGNAWFKAGMFLIAVVVGIVLAPPTNALKNWMRSVLRKTFMASEKVPPARPMEAVS
jgi:peptidoglycan/LPS O-acetylase OafA/YrhL